MKKRNSWDKKADMARSAESRIRTRLAMYIRQGKPTAATRRALARCIAARMRYMKMADRVRARSK